MTKRFLKFYLPLGLAILLIFGSVGYWQARQAQAVGIAYDNSYHWNSTPTNPWTNSFTVGSGSNRVLIVGFYANTNSLVGLTVSYAGTNMTPIYSSVVATYHSLYLYYLANPASGANNIVISSTSLGYFNLDMTAVSYTGASQSIPTNYAYPGTYNGSIGNALGGTIGGVAASLTTTVANAWLVGVSTGGDISYGIGTTPAGGVSGIWRGWTSGYQASQVLDTNGSLSTGTYAMYFCQDVSGFAILAELDPAVTYVYNQIPNEVQIQNASLIIKNINMVIKQP